MMESELSQPLVSMVIPSFNHGRYVQACIESVIAQDYRNIELIIIDDGSADDSVEKIKSMVSACAARFTRFEFRSRPNKGLAATLNEALEWCGGKYFAAIASDDLLHANKTSLLMTHIARDETVAGAFSGCEFIDQDGSIVGRLSPRPCFYTFEDVITHKHVIVAPSQLLRLSSIREVGLYPPGLYIEDWYMWLALTRRGYRLQVVPDLLVKYRRHEMNISRNAQKMYESRKCILNWFNDHPLYKVAMAQINAAAAIDFSCVSRRQAADYLCRAAEFSWAIVLTRTFLSGFIRLFIPCSLVRALARLKSWLRNHGFGVRHSW